MSCRTEQRESELAARLRTRETDPIVGDIYLAGERVPPGIYRQIGASREVRLDQEDYLPASLDGRVACYERVPLTHAVIIAPTPQAREASRS